MIYFELRNYATKRGNISQAHRAVVKNLKETGHGVPINDQVRMQRVELGLPELPPTLFKYKDEDKGELQKMAEQLFNIAPAQGNTTKKDDKKEA